MLTISRSLAIAGACAALWPWPAAAQVMQIGTGSVEVYSGPTVFTTEGATAIAPAPHQAPTAGTDISGLIAEASARYALPQTLVRAVAWRESHLMQSAVSPKGAIGVMQLMPATARQLGVDPHDLRQNIHGGAAYLSQMLARYRGDAGLALAAYNAGPAAVDHYRGAPPFSETRRYVADILNPAPAVLEPSSPLVFSR